MHTDPNSDLRKQLLIAKETDFPDVAEYRDLCGLSINEITRLDEIRQRVCDYANDHDLPGLKFIVGWKFPETWCSQCGASLGPGDHGLSHCHQHRASSKGDGE